MTETNTVEKKELKTNWRPLGDRLIVFRAPARTKITGTSLDLPETSQILPSVGEIIHAGPGRLDEKGDRHPMELRAGDKVVFNRNAGVSLDGEDENLIVIKETDVMAVDRS